MELERFPQLLDMCKSSMPTKYYTPGHGNLMFYYDLGLYDKYNVTILKQWKHLTIHPYFVPIKDRPEGK